MCSSGYLHVHKVLALVLRSLELETYVRSIAQTLCLALSLLGPHVRFKGIHNACNIICACSFGNLRISLLPNVVAVQVRASFLNPNLCLLHKILLSAVSHKSRKGLLYHVLTSVSYRTVAHQANLCQYLHIAQTLSSLGVHQRRADIVAWVAHFCHISVYVLSGSLVKLSQRHIPVEHAQYSVVCNLTYQSTLVVRIYRIISSCLHLLPEVGN